jgi:hypothetical protein
MPKFFHFYKNNFVSNISAGFRRRFGTGNVSDNMTNGIGTIRKESLVKNDMVPDKIFLLKI